MTYKSNKLIAIAKACGATTHTSYYLSLEGAEVPYKLLSMTEAQLQATIDAYVDSQLEVNDMTKLDYLKQNASCVKEVKVEGIEDILIYGFTEQALIQAIAVINSIDEDTHD